MTNLVQELALLCLFCLLAGIWTAIRLRTRCMPGPLGIPILGSFPFLTHYPERTLDKWAKRYGKLYSLWLGDQQFVIVSCPQIAKDLFVTAGSVFSSRKEMFIKAQTVFALRGITATPYNARWRKHRKIASTWLNSRALAGYAAVVDRETTDMVMRLAAASAGNKLVNPQPFAGRCSLNCMLTITFGTRTETMYDVQIARSLRLSREFMNLTGPMSNIVDFVPLLQKLCQWVPLKTYARGQALHDALIAEYGGMARAVGKRADAPDCLVRHVLAETDRTDLQDIDVAMLVSAFMIGGVETTASIMQWFSALIPSYPDIQARAHAELDAVVGRDRLPTAADEHRLPFCRAIIKETERCHNPFWLGTPHCSTEDYSYNGHLIPKGTVVVCNTYTMHHDERHEAPMDFNPDRYLGDALSSEQSANLADPMRRDHWMFGAGRRICPGMAVAEREIWLAVSRMLWAFEIQAVDEHPVDLNEYDGLSGRSPVPFYVRLVPRHDNVARVLAK